MKSFEITREFDLLEVLKGTDEEFCEKFGIRLSDLRKIKKKKPYKTEVDRLWVYTPEK